MYPKRHFQRHGFDGFVVELAAYATTSERFLEDLTTPTRSGRRESKKFVKFVRRHGNAEDLPKHVKHCHARGARDWWIWVWQKNNSTLKTRIPYRCGSWRCEDCRVHEAHVAWTRMRDAFEPLDASGIVFLVLTLDRKCTYSKKKHWNTAQDAFRELGALTSGFLRNLRRWAKSNGWKPLKNQWVQTIEAHQSGWPHANIVLWSPELAEWIAEEKKAKLDDHITEDQSRYVSSYLADMVTRAGWGLLSTAERANSKEETLGYICKTAGKVDESIGELAKLSQLPMAAPFRFRRIRSGVGFLPKRKKNENVTGTLVRRQHSVTGYDVIPLHNVKGDAAIENCECACATEEKIWYGELEASVRCKKQVRKYGMAAVEPPPVTRWINGVRLAHTVPQRNRENETNNLLFTTDEIIRQQSA